MPSAGWTSRTDQAGASRREETHSVTIRARVVSEIGSVDAGDWEKLEHDGNPFLSHAFLAALEQSGSVGGQAGWIPHHLAVYEDECLVAFAPTYIKTHSHGEFVFDWAWADAYQRHGKAYYPKLLTGIPFSPVQGRRLLTRSGHRDPEGLRQMLVQMALEQSSELQLSSWHCNFVTADDDAALAAAGLLARNDWQYHWQNRGYGDFGEFLADLRSRKRKNIRRERRQVQDAGFRFRWLNGNEIEPRELDFVNRCYLRTFRRYGNHPALNRSFFEEAATHLGEHMLIVLAERDDEPLAMSLFLTGGGRLYGRYWGSLADLPALHFETAYYQGIEYCIRHGLKVFESGAQGEHKIARGFQPHKTVSFHFLRDPRFRAAIAGYLQRERAWMADYGQELAQHDPFRERPS